MRVGITGNIASGKTAILKYLAEKGYNIFSCDSCVNQLYSDKEVAQNILKIFPELDHLDKTKIAEIIYSDKQKRSELEKIIHPLVEQKLEEFLSKHQDKATVFLEIPLLFEVHWEKYCDLIITLYCDKNIRKERAIERGISAELFLAIDNTQINETIKIQKADFSIDTSTSWEKVLEQLCTILDKAI